MPSGRNISDRIISSGSRGRKRKGVQFNRNAQFSCGNSKAKKLHFMIWRFWRELTLNFVLDSSTTTFTALDTGSFASNLPQNICLQEEKNTDDSRRRHGSISLKFFLWSAFFFRGRRYKRLFCHYFATKHLYLTIKTKKFSWSVFKSHETPLLPPQNEVKTTPEAFYNSNNWN